MKKTLKKEDHNCYLEFDEPHLQNRIKPKPQRLFFFLQFSFLENIGNMSAKYFI